MYGKRHQSLEDTILQKTNELILEYGWPGITAQAVTNDGNSYTIHISGHISEEKCGDLLLMLALEVDLKANRIKISQTLNY